MFLLYRRFIRLRITIIFFVDTKTSLPLSAYETTMRTRNKTHHFLIIWFWIVRQVTVRVIREWNFLILIFAHCLIALTKISTLQTYFDATAHINFTMSYQTLTTSHLKTFSEAVLTWTGRTRGLNLIPSLCSLCNIPTYHVKLPYAVLLEYLLTYSIFYKLFKFNVYIFWSVR